MMVPYCDAFEIADKIGAFMKQAVALRAEKKDAEARALVMDNAVPLWLKVAPMVRDTMLTYQAIVATRNDQGQTRLHASDATIEYYAAASGNPRAMSAPPQAPANIYTLNVLSS